MMQENIEQKPSIEELQKKKRAEIIQLFISQGGEFNNRKQTRIMLNYLQDKILSDEWTESNVNHRK